MRESHKPNSTGISVTQTLTSQGAAHWAAPAEPGKDGRCFPEVHRPPFGDCLVGLTDPLTQAHCITVGGGSRTPHLPTTVFYAPFYGKGVSPEPPPPGFQSPRTEAPDSSALNQVSIAGRFIFSSELSRLQGTSWWVFSFSPPLHTSGCFSR